MQTYREFRPTGFDVAGLGCDDRQDWLVGPCSITRDSGILDLSNWHSMIADFERIDPDGEDHEIHSFGHWACGWFEIVLIRPNSAVAQSAEEIEGALENYPVLSDDDYSEREYEAVCEAWENYSLRDRIRECARAGVSIFAARRDNPYDVSDYIVDALRG